MTRFALIAATAVLSFAGLAQAAITDAGGNVGWDAFVIRDSNGATAGGTQPNVVVNGSGQVEFHIVTGSQKAALGTNLLNGFSLNQINNLSIDRLDNFNRFSAGSGPNRAPYMNFWITDGAGNYAVLANEPTNPEWNSPAGSQWDATWASLQGKTAKLFEFSSSFAKPAGSVYTFNNFANYRIEAPSAAYIANVLNNVGAGAPRDINNGDTAYGFNWVFGDTLANYVTDGIPYIVDNAAASAVPLPTTAAAGLALSTLLTIRRRRQA